MSDEPGISAQIVMTLKHIRGRGYVSMAALDDVKIACPCGWSQVMHGAGVEPSNFYGYAIGWCERAAEEHLRTCQRAS